MYLPPSPNLSPPARALSLSVCVCVLMCMYVCVCMASMCKHAYEIHIGRESSVRGEKGERDRKERET